MWCRSTKPYNHLAVNISNICKYQTNGLYLFRSCKCKLSLPWRCNDSSMKHDPATVWQLSIESRFSWTLSMFNSKLCSWRKEKVHHIFFFLHSAMQLSWPIVYDWLGKKQKKHFLVSTWCTHHRGWSMAASNTDFLWKYTCQFTTTTLSLIIDHMSAVDIAVYI